MTTPLSVRALRGFLCLAFLGLGACGQKEAPPPDAATIAALRPADPRLAEIYAASCLACHTMADSGAPLTGDGEQWKPRLNKGMSVLLKNVVEGVNGMPAGGQCFACTPEDYTALILFMSQPPR
ncbi:c-type cytochrome [Niveispirillum cyanobacteriorum]|uniref:Cytochrome c5 family protein n=1 Tax=Niveispirillum cyanobacteriorum TaxID=1612173 RepID=A0A2K9NH49_9PROT|nr:c-type cytochrome [Niveispirillum cyanobacteriorum]AUN32404.1 cytochrome c5 family protein [Niveispirillum cyanobacteriorum]GGE78684.1 mono-heme cytochrome C [Niveispirillum cyanobacteriorum]